MTPLKIMINDHYIFHTSSIQLDSEINIFDYQNRKHVFISLIFGKKRKKISFSLGTAYAVYKIY